MATPILQCICACTTPVLYMRTAGFHTEGGGGGGGGGGGALGFPPPRISGLYYDISIDLMQVPGLG